MVYRRIGEENYVTIGSGAILFNMEIEQFEEKLARHKVVLAKYGKTYYMSVKLVEEWLQEREKFVLFKDIIYGLIDKTNSNYIKKYSTLIKHKVYCEGYKFWGAEVYYDLPYFSSGNGNFYIRKKDVSIIEENLWEDFCLYNQSNEYKIEYLLECEQFKTFENTKHHVRKFQTKLNKQSVPAYVEMINLLRHTLTKDLKDYSEKEIVEYLEFAGKKLSKHALINLVDLYREIQKQEKCNQTTIISFKREEQEKKDVEPYDPERYYQIAHMVFNPNYWEKNNMIQKAINSGYDSRIWLYHAMLFVCAWRKNDMVDKLPRIELFDEPKVVFDKILNNQYSEIEYKRIAYQVEAEVNMRAKKPNKTKRLQATPEIHISIPDCFASTIGMVMMLCEAHGQIENWKGGLLKNAPSVPECCCKFFGEYYEKILNEKAISNIKANKSYLRMIKETENSSINGYMLAAYARSHRINIESIPEVTSVYLKAKADHYSVDEITKALFQRGTCSFVPYLLCDFLDKNFKEISIDAQTEVMKNIPYTPGEIEKILKLDEKLEKKTKEKIAEIIKWGSEENLYEMIIEALESIASGQCVGKLEGIYCIRKACKKECAEKNRKTCVGCSYEIYTRGFLHELNNEIQIQKEFLKNAKTKAEYIKRSSIINERLYPAVIEVLSLMKYQYGQNIEDYKELLTDIREEGDIK